MYNSWFMWPFKVSLLLYIEDYYNAMGIYKYKKIQIGMGWESFVFFLLQKSEDKQWAVVSRGQRVVTHFTKILLKFLWRHELSLKKMRCPSLNLVSCPKSNCFLCVFLLILQVEDLKMDQAVFSLINFVQANIGFTTNSRYHYCFDTWRK